MSATFGCALAVHALRSSGSQTSVQADASWTSRAIMVCLLQSLTKVLTEKHFEVRASDDNKLKIWYNSNQFFVLSSVAFRDEESS